MKQADAVMRELQQNITYRGLTLKEYCESQGVSEEELREKEIIPEAKRRLKAGLVLSELSTIEKIDVTKEEINARMDALRLQYQKRS